MPFSSDRLLARIHTQSRRHPGTIGSQAGIGIHPHFYNSTMLHRDECMPPLISSMDIVYLVLITTFAWRSLSTGGTCIIQPSRSRGRSHSQFCCVAFPSTVIVITTTSSSFSHACACHVYIHVLYPTEIH